MWKEILLTGCVKVYDRFHFRILTTLCVDSNSDNSCVVRAAEMSSVTPSENGRMKIKIE
jgi:hypothetical protein